VALRPIPPQVRGWFVMSVATTLSVQPASIVVEGTSCECRPPTCATSPAPSGFVFPLSLGSWCCFSGLYLTVRLCPNSRACWASHLFGPLWDVFCPSGQSAAGSPQRQRSLFSVSLDPCAQRRGVRATDPTQVVLLLSHGSVRAPLRVPWQTHFCGRTTPFANPLQLRCRGGDQAPPDRGEDDLLEVPPPSTPPTQVPAGLPALVSGEPCQWARRGSLRWLIIGR